jgi:cytochrome c peroxidase
MLANVVFYMTEPPEIKCNKSFTKIKRFQTQVMSKIGQTNRRNYINMPILVEEQYLKEI